LMNGFANVLPEIHLLRNEIFPEWRRISKGDVLESLMTTRVLQWIADQYTTDPLADIINGSLIKLV
jgi:hypothetical protein